MLTNYLTLAVVGGSEVRWLGRCSPDFIRYYYCVWIRHLDSVQISLVVLDTRDVGRGETLCVTHMVVMR